MKRLAPPALALAALLAAACTPDAAPTPAPAPAPAPAAPTEASAPAADARANRRFERMDGDKDGRVSQAEFTAAAAQAQGQAGEGKEGRDPAQLFARRDKNKDGFLTPDEMERGGGGKRDKTAADGTATDAETEAESEAL